MNNHIVFTGNCEKYDLVLAIAALLRAYHEQRVIILTNQKTTYQYFDGEVSGILINPEDRQETDLVIYDWYEGYPEGEEDSKLVFVTSYERRSLDHIEQIIKQGRSPSSFVLIEDDCKLQISYVQKLYRGEGELLTYFSSSSRKIDWEHDGRVHLKVDKDFAETVNEILIEVCEIPQKDIKKLWTYARKRG